MRPSVIRLPVIACLIALAGPAGAQGLSAEIGTKGLTAVEARLAALPAPTNADRFALGGVRFLRTVEGAVQRRWQHGVTDSMAMLPFLRLPLDENPAPAAFAPEVIADLFRDVAAGMADARAPLAGIADGAEFGVEIALADLWFDVNANGTRDAGEDLLQIAGPMILGWRWDQRDPAAALPVIRFDSADAAWLTAYTHLLGGLAQTVLAFDPTAPLARMMQARVGLADLRGPAPTPGGFHDSFGDFADYAYVVIEALRQPPDAERMAQVQGHLLAMVANNRRFWTLVATETDNDREWLPSDRQTSALGLVVPQGTGAVWQAVLVDLEAVAKGDKLVPYWRAGPAAGVNLGKYFANPAPVDLPGWIQGASALPYLDRGAVIDGQSWAAFNGLVQGEAMLFSILLN